jgi:hypothetical protein
MSAFAQVKNTEASVSKSERTCEVEAFIIRAAMGKKSGHTRYRSAIGWSKRPKIVQACETTH